MKGRLFLQRKVLKIPEVLVAISLAQFHYSQTYFKVHWVRSLKPKAAVYTYAIGIWIRNSKFKDTTIMSFYGNRLEVTGRDRNEVDADELLEAVAYILHRCNDMVHLRMDAADST
jgi:hypothetical protein